LCSTTTVTITLDSHDCPMEVYRLVFDPDNRLVTAQGPLLEPLDQLERLGDSLLVRSAPGHDAVEIGQLLFGDWLGDHPWRAAPDLLAP